MECEGTTKRQTMRKGMNGMHGKGEDIVAREGKRGATWEGEGEEKEGKSLRKKWAVTSEKEWDEREGKGGKEPPARGGEGV